MDLTRVLSRQAGVVEAEVDGQRVLMSPTDFAYFGLVETGAHVWDRIDDITPLGELIDNLARDHGADHASVTADVFDFVSALDAAGLLASDEK